MQRKSSRQMGVRTSMPGMMLNINTPAARSRYTQSFLSLSALLSPRTLCLSIPQPFLFLLLHPLSFTLSNTLLTHRSELAHTRLSWPFLCSLSFSLFLILPEYNSTPALPLLATTAQVRLNTSVSIAPHF